MTIDAHQFRRNEWVLGRNRRELATGDPLGGNNSRRFDFDGFWSGVKWVKGTRNASTFDTEAAALKYLEANFTKLDA